ncbi:acetyl-CoA carboxylase biotin carboxyl carrier protein [Haloactinopolyspora alba]|uniref:acetyl-CoA carboxylase biotin carboxyl carrier protein n=1 Tax=Haloactinopolyspora alba TaxID=648780 RepID=UPI00197AFC51|nr:biotin/lipoyl-containing protein [Haloactinopolyspora alba]
MDVPAEAPAAEAVSGPERQRLISHLRSEASALLTQSGEPVQVVELTAGDCSVRLERPAPVSAPVAPGNVPVAAPEANGQVPGASADGLGGPAGEDDGTPVHPVRAPLVGTFYRRPGPDAKPFVEVDDQVEAGQTLAIVEAMKLMNEIRSDRAGRVVAVRPADGQMVEFDEVLVELAVADA